MTITFHVYGVAQPQGSAQAFIPKGWTRAIVTSDNKKNKPWRQVVAAAAQAAVQQQRWAFAGKGVPVQLRVTFRLPRPKAIKAKDVPHLTKPDLDKLIRSCCDALTGIVFKDDSQVNEIITAKVYAKPGESPHVAVTVNSPDPATGYDLPDSGIGTARPVNAVGQPGNFPPIQLQDQRSAPEWTCQTCGGDALFCGHGPTLEERGLK